MSNAKTMQKSRSTWEFFGIFSLTLEFFPCVLWDELCHVHFKVCAGCILADAFSKCKGNISGSTCLKPWSNREWALSSTFWAWFSPLDSWSPTVHWSWRKQCSLVPVCKAMLQGPVCWPCLVHSLPARGDSHSGPLLEHICLPHSLSGTGTPCPCPCPTDILLPLLFTLYLPAAVPFGFSQMLVPGTTQAVLLALYVSLSSALWFCTMHGSLS